MPDLHTIALMKIDKHATVYLLSTDDQYEVVYVIGGQIAERRMLDDEEEARALFLELIT